MPCFVLASVVYGHRWSSRQKMDLLLTRELLADVTSARSEIAAASLLSKLYVHLAVKGRTGFKPHPQMASLKGSGYGEVSQPQSHQPLHQVSSGSPADIAVSGVQADPSPIPCPVIPAAPTEGVACDNRIHIGSMKLVMALFHVPEHALNVHRSTFSVSYARDRIAARMELYPAEFLEVELVGDMCWAF